MLHNIKIEACTKDKHVHIIRGPEAPCNQKLGVRFQFWRISSWPICFLLIPFGKHIKNGRSHLRISPPNNRRKFRSQTSDNMDRWKSRDGKSQRREEKKREDQRRERVRRKKMQVRDKVDKSRCTVFFQWFVAPEGRKVGSPKRLVRSHLAGWEMKNCTPLWCEAHFQVKMYKTPHVRSTFGSWDVEKAHAVVARSTFRS